MDYIMDCDYPLYIYIYLVGGAITILKNMKVSWDYFPNILWNIKHV